MKKYLTFLLSIILCSCLQIPTPEIVSDVSYSFSGGDDLLDVFDLSASYSTPEKEVSHEKITTLPWMRKKQLPTPFIATLIISFTPKKEIPDKDFYYLGFSSDISYNNKTKYPSSTKSASDSIVLSSITINNSDKYTFSRKVVIRMDFNHAPTHVKIWEEDNEPSVEWNIFTSNTFVYLISDFYGEKTIHAKIKDETSESDMVSSSILFYREPDENTVSKEKLDDFLYQLNGYNHTVTVSIPNTL